MSKKWKIILLVSFSVLVILAAAGAFIMWNTQKHSPVQTINFNENGLKLETVYCRPYKKGRLVFGDEESGALQPYGLYWRLGANWATTIEVNKSVIVAGQSLDPGKYSIYAVPGKETWQIGINAEVSRWGVPEPDYSQDVFTVTVPVSYSDNVVEQLTLAYEATDTGAELVIKWETSVVRLPIN